MKLLFRGHDYRYAIEQSLLAFFPEERPVYEGEDSSFAEVVLEQEGDEFTATTHICFDGKEGRGISRTRADASLSTYEQEGLKQRICKLSFFHAYTDLTGNVPTWGALTGVRPAKLAAKCLEQGMSASEVDTLLKDTYCVSDKRRKLCIESAQVGIQAKNELRPNDISLYVGIPFCPTRCAYCSFVSQSVEKSFHLMDPYLDALLNEITLAGKMVKDAGLHIQSFYMGGGTPTTLSSAQMDRLLKHLNQNFDFSSSKERCVEAGRPDTIDREKLQVLLDNGIDRISINPQTLEDSVLKAIGRNHSAKDIEGTMALAKSLGFPHINMDLIAGLSTDTLEGFQRSLDGCIAMGADNITVHTLALKKGSRYTLEGSALPDSETVGKMLDYALETLPSNAFHPYYLYRQKYMSGSFENVGWCKDGAEGLYNIYIMEELHSILSLGAGGSTKMVDPISGKIARSFHAKYPEEYIANQGKAVEILSSFSDFYKDLSK